MGADRRTLQEVTFIRSPPITLAPDLHATAHEPVCASVLTHRCLTGDVPGSKPKQDNLNDAQCQSRVDIRYTHLISSEGSASDN